jgi:hypothetical protein
MAPPTSQVYFSNTGDQIIRVEIAALKPTAWDTYVDASSMESTAMHIGTVYNIKLSKGRTVKRFRYVGGAPQLQCHQ